jgi:GMP synthase-like glutamine amidotransferase
VKEIGWFPIQAVKSESDSVFQFPEETEVFHWHGETFNLPNGAVRIAESRSCLNQAFQIGSNVIGLQFHLETTPASAQKITENCRHELVEGPCIQSEEDILAVSPARYSAVNRMMVNVLNHLHAKIG